MTTRLLLVRHGDSHHKAAGIAGGPLSCKGLTDVGREQVIRLRDRLVARGDLGGPLHFYASVVPRAVETAEILAAGLAEGATVTTDCDLCSWHVPPDRDGMTWAEYQRQFSVPGGGVYLPFESGSESWAELVTRAGRALSRLAQRHRGETVVIGAHTETVNASFVALGHLPLMLPLDLRVGNASLTEWHTDGDPFAFPPPRWTLARFNEESGW
jgi:2,3-bisphosphoglycerate-dependent phosphoglycerate mutase